MQEHEGQLPHGTQVRLHAWVEDDGRRCVHPPRGGRSHRQPGRRLQQHHRLGVPLLAPTTRGQVPVEWFLMGFLEYFFLGYFFFKVKGFTYKTLTP